MEEKGEQQLETYFYDRLILQKVSICSKIQKNKFKIWDKGSNSTRGSFSPSNSLVTKLRSAVEYRHDLANEVFQHELLGIAQSVAETSDSLYHGQQSELKKRFSFCMNTNITRF